MRPLVVRACVRDRKGSGSDEPPGLRMTAIICNSEGSHRECQGTIRTIHNPGEGQKQKPMRSTDRPNPRDQLRRIVASFPLVLCLASCVHPARAQSLSDSAAIAMTIPLPEPLVWDLVRATGDYAIVEQEAGLFLLRPMLLGQQQIRHGREERDGDQHRPEAP